MSNNPLLDYIRQAQRQGLSVERILAELTAAGWRPSEVVEILLNHLNFQQPQSSPKIDSEHIISVHGVSKAYGQLKAVDNVDLTIKQGAVTALLGPNGAGKTTLVRMMTTLLVPDAGDISVAGYDVVSQAQQLRSVIGLTGQYAAVDETLTGRENLEMVGRLYHLPAKQARERATELLEEFNLTDAGNRTLKTYSGGMRRRLDLAASLIIKPEVLFLDEPTTGLDPRSRFELWHVIRQLVEGGTTVLLTTQYLEEADQLANYIYVIDHGHIIAQGTADDLKRQVGGDVLELHMNNHHDAPRAGKILRPFGKEEPVIDTETGLVTVPVTGASVLPEVVRVLDGAGLKLSDIILRRPSLDDVFMKLTGHRTE
ncbi:MAG TPA: ATP-binding cassette domain-containing protein [Candidatus Paceibacterota bacterium]|nr:ATP-binding cassette domain-containing protein [Candidatus Paceibacterota bacterium]